MIHDTCLHLVLEGVPAVDDQLVEGQRLLRDRQVNHRPQLLRLEREKLLKNLVHIFLLHILLSISSGSKIEDLHSTFWRLEYMDVEKPFFDA